MKISIGSDHAGFPLKEFIKTYLKESFPDSQVTDCGSFSPEPVDYPDIAQIVAKAVANQEADRGILICGTGIGMCISANKVPGARAAQCEEPVSARLSRAHNNANIVTFGGRTTGTEIAKAIVSAFLEEKFQGGKHEVRVNKIKHLETEFSGCV